jgi:hypothetical protein
MPTTILLSHKPGYGWSARHIPTDIASQGDSEPEALHALSEALTLHGRDEEHAVEASDEWYDRFGVSPRR